MQQLREEWRRSEDERQNPAAPWLKNTRSKSNKTVTYWETIWPDIVEMYDFVTPQEQNDA